MPAKESARGLAVSKSWREGNGPENGRGSGGVLLVRKRAGGTEVRSLADGGDDLSLGVERLGVGDGGERLRCGARSAWDNC